MNVLVTGRLGLPTVQQLRSRGHEVRILSHRPGADHAVADLATGAGLAAALDGIDTVVHLATTGRKDIEQTRVLLDALRGGSAHLVFISIVGVDRIPFGYYRDKVASERLIEASGLPFTIIRVTQFHDFVGAFLAAQRRLPVTIVIPVPLQTIDVAEVATRLAELVDAGPAGRVADIGGPEQLTVRAMAEQWQRARGRRRPIWTLRLPGKTMRTLAAGEQTSGLPGYGTVTFGEYLARDAAAARATNEA